ncbi:alpha-hydroxy-acid oxidizing enzyme [Azorhizobium oxalatiphilum]|uniref:Alpha-hydroxy-acid oxidizing enzyme n=1 Tax=Azorhizobium oxalatiphilum TaxID=980631 RepID=A0A917BTM1_9HYPH|nr:alpha-hydroxy acid oxidase [Azorhizobium oxalatiphilum]GGF56255.1 alpha-hydroxy-acid oxidizing enzyme [Azorhizobium oxalatiphilum]
MPITLPDAYDLADYERLARERISEPYWAYLASLAGNGLTQRMTREAYDRLRLAPRVLADLSGASTRIRLFGASFEHPILLAPVAYHRLFHPDGEIAVAQGAGATDTPLVVSTHASTGLEDIRAASQGPQWFQLYIQPDWDFTAALVRRAEAAGYGALVVTVDAPVSLRVQARRAGFQLPPEIDAVNLRGLVAAEPQPSTLGGSPLFGGSLPPAPVWADVARLRALTRLPILLKGVMAPEDASRALAEGLDGLIVSNHGGRVLDSVPPTIEVLPAVLAAVDRRIPVLVDGGIRHGTDILKAMALGASAVLIGRPYIHGLAMAGALGVAHVVHLLRAELEVAMALTGCTGFDTAPSALAQA